MKDILLVAGLLAAPLTTSIHDYRAKPAPMDTKDPRLARLKEYFGARGCPLKDAAKDFLAAADENSLDWRLLPSISMIESSGGKDYKNNNVFGWNSAKSSFPSVRAGIHFVAKQLSKSNRYKGKDVTRKLQIYNPLPEYPQKVKAVMRAIAASTQIPAVAAD